MKIFEEKIAPNARRVRMFLAEKSISDIEYVQLDLKKGDNVSKEFKQMNPLAKIPVMELEDGSYLSESVAICRYFEAHKPSPSLMGETPLQQANIEMWQRRCELYFMNLIGMGFQHCSGFFADRMTPVPEWGQECVKDASKFMPLLNDHLASNEYISGDTFSIADITAFVSIDFARVIKIRISGEYTHLLRWYEQINSRPSARA